MLGLIKYIFAIVLFIWFLTREYTINKIVELGTLVTNFNDNVFSHINLETKLLFGLFIFAIIFIFIKNFYDNSRD